jgi:hypothetical protein
MTYVGRYLLKNPKKYMGVGTNPIYKSGHECRMMAWFDTNEKVIKWGYEIINIPYFFPVDSKIHKYSIDFYSEVINNQGVIKKYLTEIKSDGDLEIPKKPSNPTTQNMKRYKNKMIIHIRNTCKWKAAEQFCKQAGITWQLLSTRDIF